MLSVNSPPRVCYCALVSFWHFFPHSCWSIPDFIGPTSYPLIFVFGVGPAVGHPNLDSLLPKKAFDMWIRADFWATHFTWETRLPQRLPDGTYNPAWLAARRWRLTAGRFVSVRRVGQHRRLAKEGSCGKHGEWWDEVQTGPLEGFCFVYWISWPPCHWWCLYIEMCCASCALRLSALLLFFGFILPFVLGWQDGYWLITTITNHGIGLGPTLKIDSGQPL